jgi:hypothetical protein
MVEHVSMQKIKKKEKVAYLCGAWESAESLVLRLGGCSAAADVRREFEYVPESRGVGAIEILKV